MGSVNLALTLAPNVTLDSASYSITAPGFSRSGSLDLRQSTTLSATIGGLPAGPGFFLALAATLSDGMTTCSGSASFDVSPLITTQVSVHLLCHEPPRTGRVQIGGTINICPLVDAVTASAGEAKVGGTIALTGAGHDTDSGPAPLALTWTATSGTFSDAAAARPTFTCVTAGAATITLTASDGDCSDAVSLPVTCTPVTTPPPPPPMVVINEVESNGGTPGDWVELYNAGGSAADLAGWVFKDNDDTHGFTLPAGTSLAPGGYLVLEEAAFGFGLGAADAARLYGAGGGNLVDSYSWTAHAATTYGRCPNGAGAFATTASSTKGAANDCATSDGGAAGDGGGDGGGGAPGDGGASDGATDGGGGAVVDSGAILAPWPGPNVVTIVDQVGQFSGNLSGLSYDPATTEAPAVMWAVQNGPSTLYRLVSSTATMTWASTATDDWGAGKALHYPDGTGAPDSEGVTKAEAGSTAIYVSTERNNDVSGVSRLSVLRFDTADVGPALTATHEWNLTADLPPVGSNLGLEAITWIPDRFLVAAGFVDDSTGQPYAPATYANHGTGIFFVGVEATGMVHGYALDHFVGGFHRVASFSGGQPSVMDLSFDRDSGYLWAYCDNTCGNRAAVLQIDGAVASPTRGRFGVSRFFDRPGTLPDINNEGIAIAPDAECTNGLKSFYWTDDGATGGNSLRRDAIPCGRFF